jgi:hypothetical protein
LHLLFCPPGILFPHGLPLLLLSYLWSNATDQEDLPWHVMGTWHVTLTRSHPLSFPSLTLPHWLWASELFYMYLFTVGSPSVSFLECWLHAGRHLLCSHPLDLVTRTVPAPWWAEHVFVD